MDQKLSASEDQSSPILYKTVIKRPVLKIVDPTKIWSNMMYYIIKSFVSLILKTIR